MDTVLLTRRIFTRFLAAFCIFLLLMLSVLLPLVLNGTNAVAERSRQLYIETVEKNLSRFDEQLTSLTIILRHIGTQNTDFQSLCQRLSGSDYLKLKDMQEHVQSVLSGFSYARDVVILTESDLIITRTCSVPNRLGMTEMFFANRFQMEGVTDAASFRTVLSSMPLCVGISSETYGKYHAIGFSIPIFNTNMVRLAYAVVMLDADDLLDDLAPEGFLEHGMAALYYHDQALYTVGQAPDNSKVTIAALSEGNHIGVQFTVPSSMLFNGVEKITLAMWMELIVTFLGGLTLSLYFALKTGRPMRKLAQLAQSVAPKIEGHNEYELVSDALGSMRESLRLSDAQIQAQRRSMQQNLLEKALLSNISSSRAKDAFAKLLPDFPSDYYVVLLLLPSAKDQSGMIELQLMVEHLFSNQFETPLYQVWMLPHYEAVILPQNLGGVAAMEKFKMAFDKQAHQEIDIFVSDVFSGPEALGEAYIHAKHIQHCSTAYTDKRVWSIGNFQNKEICSNMDYSILQRLYETVTIGDCAEAQKCLQRLRLCLPDYSDSKSENVPNAYAYRRTLEFTHSILIRVKREHFDSLSYVKLYPPDLNQTLDGYFDKLGEYVTALCEGLRLAKAHISTFNDEILAYVDDHISDPNLYYQSVTDRFHISEKSLQCAMRETVNMSFAEYVENQRLDKAYRMLTKTDASVNDIAVQAGFALYNTFYKSFKRRYGCSPTEYRTREADKKGENR